MTTARWTGMKWTTEPPVFAKHAVRCPRCQRLFWAVIRVATGQRDPLWECPRCPSELFKG